MPGQIILQMTGEERAVLAALKKVQGQVKILETNMGKAGKEMKKKFNEAGKEAEKAGKKAKDAFDPKKSLDLFINRMVGPAGVTIALGAGLKLMEAQREAFVKLGAAATKAGGDILAFAALQAGGTKRQEVLSAAALARQFGITDRGAAFNTIQALESIRGKKGGREAARGVFAATLLDIPLDLGTELEVLGASQGAEPAAFVRKAFVAGQLSGRDPKTLARAAPALKQFRDKDLGFAIAAIISESIPAEQVATFTRQAGLALQRTGALQPFFEKLGKGNAGKLERLQILKAEGITTPEQLVELGEGELRRRAALLALIKNVERIPGIKQQIIDRAVPGVLLGQRKQTESELPSLKLSRQNRQLEAMAADQAAFGAGGLEGQRQEREDRIGAMVLRRKGQETFLGFQTINEEGRLTFMGRFLRDLRIRGVRDDVEFAVRQELVQGDATLEKLDAAADKMSVAADKIVDALGGGASRIPAGSGDFRSQTRNTLAE